MGTGVRVAAWVRIDDQRGPGVGRIAPTTSGWTCHGSEVLVGPDLVQSCTFHVDLDTDWRTRHVEVDVVDAAGRRGVVLAAAGGRWTRDGAPAPDLDGCTDVDVAATPLTNTFPVRRLAQLRVDQSATIDAAWVDVPSTRVVRVEQTYTRLGSHRWRYADATYGAFELTVDDDGIVVDYAGFATRVQP